MLLHYTVMDNMKHRGRIYKIILLNELRSPLSRRDCLARVPPQSPELTLLVILRSVSREQFFRGHSRDNTRGLVKNLTTKCKKIIYIFFRILFLSYTSRFNRLTCLQRIMSPLVSLFLLSGIMKLAQGQFSGKH